jgi:hypothetical protein
MEIFTNLQRLGFLEDEPARSKSGLKQWKSLCKRRNLLSGPVPMKDLVNPVDISFLYPDSGYAPLSIRMIQQILQLGPNVGDYKEGLNQVSQLNQRESTMHVESVLNPPKAIEGECVLVYFIGGT